MFFFLKCEYIHLDDLAHNTPYVSSKLRASVKPLSIKVSKCFLALFWHLSCYKVPYLEVISLLLVGTTTSTGRMESLRGSESSTKAYGQLKHICIFAYLNRERNSPPPFSVAVILSMGRGRMRLKVQEKERTQNNILCIH